ncbi:hypothetical protein M513_07567 [Trichuris suis]|uniref:Uncharacterized protein n=1 Tax=Trichuris suis TaxID=68888 RepID=A0A085M2S1_9BILA|nr:hypothetical protein M513_07567 [Trichuris suis]
MTVDVFPWKFTQIGAFECSVLITTHPLIAQLVERWTVAFITWISIGRWFKSGSEEYDAAKMTTFASES